MLGMRSQKEKHLYVLTAKVPKSTYKLGLKEVDEKSTNSGSKGWSLNLRYEMTVKISIFY